MIPIGRGEVGRSYLLCEWGVMPMGRGRADSVQAVATPVYTAMGMNDCDTILYHHIGIILKSFSQYKFSNLVDTPMGDNSSLLP